MGEMDRQALDVVLGQLDDIGRQALRHLLDNAVTPLQLEICPGLEIDHEVAGETVTRITEIVRWLAGDDPDAEVAR